MQIDILDFTYSTIPTDIISLLEPSLMIICACLPIMRPLFRRFLPAVIGRSSNVSDHWIVPHALKHGYGPDTAQASISKAHKAPRRVSIVTPGDGFHQLRDQEEGKFGGALQFQELKSSSNTINTWHPHTPPKNGIEVTREITVESL